jgi:hypothetical protein
MTKVQKENQTISLVHGVEHERSDLDRLSRRRVLAIRIEECRVRSETGAASFGVRLETLDEQNLICCFSSVGGRFPSSLASWALTWLLVTQVVKADVVGMANLKRFAHSVGIDEIARHEVFLVVDTAVVSYSQRRIRYRSTKRTPHVYNLQFADTSMSGLPQSSEEADKG